MKNDVQHIQATLLRLVHEGADPEQIAGIITSTWRNIESALSPIIGARGVDALYKRSLYLIRTDYPWLGAVRDTVPLTGEFTALQSALSFQTSGHAVAANTALLQAFYDLLTNLIGVTLTDQLLSHVLHNHSSGEAVRGMSHDQQSKD
ncbi:MAG: hypothetical protein V4443_00165 [Pseudomonadota bacterium]